MTTPQAQPSNSSEWQLYRVLQRANLLQYYATFVAQGGDDVQQLCEAGEEEFLEIMALVGMASKPLHVRRLQKSLQEWVANPAAFQNSNSSPTGPLLAAREHPSQVYSLPSCPNTDGAGQSVWNTPTKSVSPSPLSMANMSSPSPGGMGAIMLVNNPTGSAQKMSTSPQPTPVLVEGQINAIAICATDLAKKLPFFEAKNLSMKKDINREILALTQLPMDSPNRLELMRKYGCIYGRFDSKRKGDKPMSLHEISVNEASAQLCFHLPNLLTRREDLFPLARQIVKDAGYHYSKGHSRASELNPENPSKRPKIENYLGMLDACYAKAEAEKVRREDRLSALTTELQLVSAQQNELVQQVDSLKDAGDVDKVDDLQQQLEHITNRHLQLLTEQSEILRKQSEATNSVVSHWSASLANSKSDASLSNNYFGDLQSEKDLEDPNLGSGSSSPIPNQSEDHGQTDAALTRLAEIDGTGQSLALDSGLQAAGMDNTLRAMLVCGLKLPMEAPTAQDSLFNEGLRIAQQYGMSDFAQELKQLQGDNSPESVKSDKVITDVLCKSVTESKGHEAASDDTYTGISSGDVMSRNGVKSEGFEPDVNVGETP